MPKETKIRAASDSNFHLLPSPKALINKALGTIVSAFEDVGQMELIKVRWEQINKLQLTN